MSMQINLQYVFKMSASRTHACIGTSLAYTRPTFSLQRDRHSVRRSFKTRLHRVVVFSRAGGENKRFYYRDVLLSADVEVIAVIRQISGNEFVFQQDSAPAHRARETMSSYTSRDAPDFISPEQWPPNSPEILTRWTTKSGLQCGSASTRQRFEMLTNCDSVCWTFGAALNKMSSMHCIHWPVECACVRSGGRHFEHML